MCYGLNLVLLKKKLKNELVVGHAEFSSGRQQDVSEYFMYLLEVMNKAERVHLKRLVRAHDIDAKTTPPTATVFQFHLENRYLCTLTNQVH